MNKLLGGVVLVLLVAGASVAATKLWWPSTDTLRLPGSTDTVTVTSERLDTVWRERVEWRETVDTDTVVLADTVWRTDTVRVAVLPGRWYLDSASFGEGRGDTAHYALTWLASDSSSVIRRDAVERQVQLGPVRQVGTDAGGLHVEYGDPHSCPTGLGLTLPWGGNVGPSGTCGLTARGNLDCAVGVGLTF